MSERPTVDPRTWLFSAGGVPVPVDISSGCWSSASTFFADLKATTEGDVVFRSSPLLSSWRSEDGTRRMAVGSYRVWAEDTEIATRVEVGLHVLQSWVEVGGDWRRTDDAIVPLPDDLPTHYAADSTSHAHVAVVAKALAERSRKAVHELRGFRYELEGRLGETLRGETSDRVVIAALVELRTALGMAEDMFAAEAREGLHLWLVDSEAYHSYRKAQDPLLLMPVEPARADSRPWMRVHDAAIRHCRTAAELLRAETGATAEVLAAASTVLVAAEGDRQASFNTLVGAAALGLGLPSLLLSYYGADPIFPLNESRRAIPLLLIGLSVMLACAVAYQQLPQRRLARIAIITTVVVSLTGLLALAGWAGNF